MAKSLQLLRNNTIYSSKDAAIKGLQGLSRSDGELAIARYKDGEKSYSLLGIFSTLAPAGVTIIDTAKIEEIEKTLTEQLGEVKIQDVLDKIGEASTDSTEATGLTADVEKNAEAIATLNSDEKTEGSVAKSIKDAIATAVDSLDVDTLEEDGKFVYQVSQTDGKVSAKFKQIEASEVHIDSDTTLATKLETIENSLDTVESNAAKYKLVEVETTEKEKTDGIKEKYQLVTYTVNSNGEASEEVAVDDTFVKVYFDSSLNDVNLVSEYTDDEKVVHKGQFLEFDYTLSDNTSKKAYVDVSTFLVESEFGNGLEVSAAGEVSVKLDESEDNEGYLSVSANGVKISGIDKAISDAITTAKGEISGEITNASYASSSEVKKNSDAIDVLNGSDETEGSVAKSIKDAIDGLNSSNIDAEKIDASNTTIGLSGETIKAQLEELAQAVKSSNDNHTAGNISATAIDATTTSVAVSGTTVEDQIKSLAQSVYTTTHALDGTVTKEAGNHMVISKINEVNGKLDSIETKQLAASDVSATAIEATITSVAVSGANVEEQIKSLAQSLASTNATVSSNDETSYAGVEGTAQSISVTAVENNKQTISIADDAVWDCGEY